MKIEFEKPLTPNFLRTDRGLFPLTSFKEEELIEYTNLWTNEFWKNLKRQEDSKKEGK